jgi:hypothetical protein
MPDYPELIRQSQANVKALNEKLRDLDNLHQNIKELIKQPEIFEVKYQEIVNLSEDYTNTLGAATKKYLDGNNTLFTVKVSELSAKTKEFETNINKLKDEIERFKTISLKERFDKLQETLTEASGVTNGIDITLTSLTQTISGIDHTLSSIQNTVETNHREAKQIIGLFSEGLSKHLHSQDNEAKRNVELLENRIKSLVEQNDMLKKGIKTNRIIQLAGITIILAALIYIAIKA